MKVEYEGREIDVPFPKYSCEIEGALCAWEWFLDNTEKMDEYLDGIGYAGMRMVSVQAGQIADQIYKLMESRGFEYIGAYDWEFVPAVMERIDWPAIIADNQYGRDPYQPDLAAILDDMIEKMTDFSDRWLEEAKREADKQWGYAALVDDCADVIDRTMKPSDWVKAMGEDLDLTPKQTWMRGF